MNTSKITYMLKLKNGRQLVQDELAGDCSRKCLKTGKTLMVLIATATESPPKYEDLVFSHKDGWYLTMIKHSYKN